MKIKNKKNKTNYVNYKSSGMSKKIAISAGKTVDILDILSTSQIINFGDFKRGFFEVLTDETAQSEKVTVEVVYKEKNKKKSEDSLDKVEKEVKEYTNNNKDN